MADQVQLKYNTTATVTLDVLAVHGAAEPDRVSKFPGITHEFLDGSLAEQIAGGRREITIDFNTMTALNRRKVVLWWLDPDRQILTTVGQPTVAAPALVAGGTLLESTKYNYGVRAIDVIGGGITTGSLTETTEAGAGKRTISLTWGAVTNARCYAIYRQDETNTLHWLLLDYTTELSYTDTGVITDALAIKDLGHGIDPPAAVDHIHVITTNDLDFQWGFDTELNRLLSVEIREASIFTKTAQFPV